MSTRARARAIMEAGARQLAEETARLNSSLDKKLYLEYVQAKEAGRFPTGMQAAAAAKHYKAQMEAAASRKDYASMQAYSNSYQTAMKEAREAHAREERAARNSAPKTPMSFMQKITQKNSHQIAQPVVAKVQKTFMPSATTASGMSVGVPSKKPMSVMQKIIQKNSHQIAQPVVAKVQKTFMPSATTASVMSVGVPSKKPLRNAMVPVSPESDLKNRLIVMGLCAGAIALLLMTAKTKKA